ncbi:MAG: PAS domain-containing protein [Candidatus Eisenbacteria bacterium]|nr:PAS domain-containing protein [Candidatus Latescibacterota bacterium]MBD3302105.1 PAS domain-containing protein [Candidatus Eisenbacteria bacterium]
MKIGWGAWQILALLLLALVLITISVLLDLNNVVEQTLEGTRTECQLITRTLLYQIDYIVRASEAPPLEAIRRDPRITGILQAANAAAPSVIFVAVTDRDGRAVAHSDSALVGTSIDSLPPLPRFVDRMDALELLAHLDESPLFYDFRAPLQQAGNRIATIRIGIAGFLLRERVEEVFRRGLIAGAIQLSLALGLGLLLVRILLRRIRILESGVTALREGRYEERIPETGLDEFRRLARDLNLLSEQFQKERESLDSDLGSFRQTVDLLGEGVLTLDREGRVLLVNDAAGRILGLDPARTRGEPLPSLLPEDHPVRRLLSRLQEGEESTLSFPLPPGPAEGEEYTAIAHRIDADREEAAGGFLVEMKQTRTLERLHSLVDHSRVLERLGQMASGVAHEIGNSLQAIDLEFGALQASAALSPEEIREHVRTATEEIRRLEKAVSGFLKVARLRAVRIGPVSINDLLAEIGKTREGEANLSGLDLDLALDPDLPEVQADPEVLRRAVDNLLKNAVQALPSRTGRVTISSARVDAEIRITVSDTGPGIPPEDLPRVYDLYFTTKPSGTGVGLALVRQAIELHQGEMGIDSTVGEGTAVTLRLPLRTGRGIQA